MTHEQEQNLCSQQWKNKKQPTAHYIWSHHVEAAVYQISQQDEMQRLCVYVLIFALALAAFSEASWKPHSQQRDAPLGTGANRDLELPWLEQQGPASHHRRQLGPQGPPHLVADPSKKQGPWLEEEEEAYGWMDFGRRSAEDEN
ncbi:gastrin [Pan paniscus]|nr:gastrin [Pan paniscus]